MKAAIISDSHDNLTNMDKFFSLIKDLRIEFIIHCGDVCFPESLLYFQKKFKKKIYLCLGNGDWNLDSIPKKNTQIFNDFGQLAVGEFLTAFVHYPKEAKELAKTNQYTHVFFGHTHKPDKTLINQTIVLNPGTLAGLFKPASFAIWDMSKNKFELKLLY